MIGHLLVRRNDSYKNNFFKRNYNNEKDIDDGSISAALRI